MSIKKWGVKPYYSLDYFFKSIYGRKIYKIALDGGMTCPNRDGSIDTRGCIFCSKGGSGEFAASFDVNNPSVLAQLEKGKELIAKKTLDGTQYIAYFQPYSNTYAPIDYLSKLYEKYCKESICGNEAGKFSFEEFEKEIGSKLSHGEKIQYDDSDQGEGVLYYCLWEEDGMQFCDVPVFGYYASSEKVLSKLFAKLADEVLKNGKTW